MKKRKAELYVIRSLITREFLCSFVKSEIGFHVRWHKQKRLAACFWTNVPGITIYSKLKELRELGYKVTFEEAY